MLKVLLVKDFIINIMYIYVILILNKYSDLKYMIEHSIKNGLLTPEMLCADDWNKITLFSSSIGVINEQNIKVIIEKYIGVDNNDIYNNNNDTFLSSFYNLIKFKSKGIQGINIMNIYLSMKKKEMLKMKPGDIEMIKTQEKLMEQKVNRDINTYYFKYYMLFSEIKKLFDNLIYDTYVNEGKIQAPDNIELIKQIVKNKQDGDMGFIVGDIKSNFDLLEGFLNFYSQRDEKGIIIPELDIKKTIYDNYIVQKDDDNIYFYPFMVTELQYQFKNGNYINKYNGKRFSQPFIDRIKQKNISTHGLEFQIVPKNRKLIHLSLQFIAKYNAYINTLVETNFRNLKMEGNEIRNDIRNDS